MHFPLACDNLILELMSYVAETDNDFQGKFNTTTDAQ